MYKISQFEETRTEVLHALIHAHPLGALVTATNGLSAEHIPFEIAPPTEDAPHGILRAHVARANSVWRHDGAPAMAIFQGPSAYISPAWYEEKPLSGKVVPTYNYAIVHAHGSLRAVEDPQWLLALLERLTARHESGRAAPWTLADAPRDYIDKLLRAIVGIEIRIEGLDGKWKASQNRSAQDQATAAAGLAQDPATSGMAALMQANLAAR